MDLSRPHSLVEAEEWLNEVDEYVSVDCVKYLVGNKVDMLLNVEVE
jgi:GTPase SAR1 family protein